MAVDIALPQLGESISEGTISKWLKQPGDFVEKYEPICEVETDKVNAEVPSTIEGILETIFVDEGISITVGEKICQIKPTQEVEKSEPSSSVSTSSPSMKHRYSPAVLRLAEEHQIDLTQIQGTGLGGRVTRKDVLNYLETQDTSVDTSNLEEDHFSATPSHVSAPQSTSEDTEIPLTTVRKAIADRMVSSMREIPHAWMMMEADVTGLVQLRNEQKENFQKREGIPLTYMPFFIKAVVDAIKEFPYVNAVWSDHKIVLKKQINISIAVGTEEALYVPVIHNADTLSITGLAQKVFQLVKKTRLGKLELSDTQGGTFTVNNTGSFGSIASKPIINHPQAVILSFESIVKRPVVIDQMIGIRDMINLCISLDHRILDGVMVGNFLKRVKETLESFNPQTVL